MKRAFTLIELLVTVAIMASLAVLAIGSYRAVVKGMENRGALIAVQTFVDLARQRAEIDHKPVIIYFYDEMLQADDEDMGRDLNGGGVAIAVRPVGRITAKDNDLLYDEFGDLDQVYRGENQQDADADAAAEDESSMVFYRLEDGNTVEVAPMVVSEPLAEEFILTGDTTTSVAGGSSSEESDKKIPACAYRRRGGAELNVGDAYGNEFAVLKLPSGFFFGSSAPSAIGRKRVGTMNISDNGSGAQSVTISRYRAGNTSLEKVGATEN